MNIIGYFHGVDPAACLVVDGEIVAYVEEERLVRFKHAWDIFPIRSIDFCLKKGGITIKDVGHFAYGWDLPKYTDGRMREFFDGVNSEHPPGPGTVSWQNWAINFFNDKSARERLRLNLVKFFGTAEAPNLVSHPHHASHAASAYFTSPFNEALVFTIDGSGDTQCATLWKGERDELTMIHEITIPHSLGWFYAAITEFLGFRAYDGEYKVMGLAAYGRENPKLRKGLEMVVPPARNGYDYAVDSKYIHNGPHTYSDRFTDNLVDILGIMPRQGEVPLEPIHEDLAFEAQRILEERVMTLLTHFQKETGMKNLCIGGGVALNVKMNSRIHKSGMFDDIFIFPVPSDSGNAIGAALGAYHALTKKRPKGLKHVYFGPEYDDDDIELQLKGCGLKYRKCDDIAEDTAGLIAEGKVVAWFQGGLEGGPRALGARSILADPRDTASRDRVNSAIKFREYWRPFCPSILEERAERYMKRAVVAPYMILAFDATDEAKAECPAVVHVDNTLRAQTVGKEHNRRYYDLIAAFEKKTGVGAVLNTSFNIKGEAIVASPRDALRTFWSTGIDALAIGSCLVMKPDVPMPLKPEEVIR